MSKNNRDKAKAQGRVPKLRFPEFRDAGAWEERPLGKVAEIITGNTPKTAESNNYGGDRLFVSPADISDQRYISTTKTTLSDQGFEKTRPIKPNSILFVCIGSTIGKVAQNKFECATNQQINSIVPFNEYSNDFIYSFLEKNAKQIAVIAGKQAVPIINKTLFSSVKFSYPSPPEQQKIADCLSSIDQLITAQTQKIDTLKSHKKGLMQQLFPTEGETVPKLRFPEFSGEWEEKPLRKVYTFKVTNSFSRDKLNYEKGFVKNIHYGDIHTKFSTLFDIRKETVPFINTSEAIGKIKTDSYCIECDMVFADASEDLNDVGKSIEIVNLNNEKLLSGLHTLLARQKNSELVIGFGGYLFKSNDIRTGIKKEAQGSKVLGISAGRLSNINIYFPTNKKEQQKIAACLSSLDQLITAQTQKLDTLKTHKKGLMQQLFVNSKENV